MSWFSLVIEQNTSHQLATSSENLVASEQCIQDSKIVTHWLAMRPKIEHSIFGRIADQGVAISSPVCIVLDCSCDISMPEEKLQTVIPQNFGGLKEVYYGICASREFRGRV